MVFVYLGAAFLAALAAWLIGPFVTRAFGVLLAVFGLFGMIDFGLNDKLAAGSNIISIFCDGIRFMGCRSLDARL